jgi:hypothetical protein
MDGLQMSQLAGLPDTIKRRILLALAQQDNGDKPATPAESKPLVHRPLPVPKPETSSQQGGRERAPTREISIQLPQLQHGLAVIDGAMTLSQLEVGFHRRGRQAAHLHANLFI